MFLNSKIIMDAKLSLSLITKLENTSKENRKNIPISDIAKLVKSLSTIVLLSNDYLLANEISGLILDFVPNKEQALPQEIVSYFEKLITKMCEREDMHVQVILLMNILNTLYTNTKNYDELKKILSQSLNYLKSAPDNIKTKYKSDIEHLENSLEDCITMEAFEKALASKKFREPTKEDAYTQKLLDDINNTLDNIINALSEKNNYNYTYIKSALLKFLKFLKS